MRLKIVDYTSREYDAADAELMAEIKAKHNCGLTTPEELLNKLPKQVIKNGQIINVRDNIGKDYFGKVDVDNLNKENKQDNVLMSNVERIIKKNGNEDCKYISVKVRFNNNVYTVKIGADEMMSDVYRYIRDGLKISDEFVLKSLPNKVYNDEDKLLTDLNINKDFNANIMIMK